MKNFKYTFTFALLLVGSIGLAGVNLKNGNFYTSYTDIVVPGDGNPLEITRTYNSKSFKKGWFGFGWGTPIETYLEVSADGSVLVHENRSGAVTRFTPKKTIDPSSSVDKIIAQMRKNGKIDKKTAKAYRKKFMDDAELRQLYAKKYGVKATLAKGTKLYSNVRGLQTLTKTKKGYVREFNEGRVQVFDEAGKLIEDSKKGYKITFIYEKGKLKTIKDSAAKQLHFDWYSNGRVKEVWSAGDKKALYKYDGDDLVYNKDISGNIYEYKYDGNHNLVEVVYKGENKSMKISYDGKTGMVASVTDKSGEATKYKYGANPKNPFNHYWTIVSRKGPSGKMIDNRYEYEIRNKPDGERYTHKILTIINGVKTETTYTQCCGLPKMIVRGNFVTDFKYTDDGLLEEKKSSNGEFVKLQYHKVYKKITRVQNNSGWTVFSYNNNGDLATAKNKAGMKVNLLYNFEGRIRKMTDHNEKTKKSRILSFIYNPQGRPVEITMDKVGKITVEYDNYGEIKKVESKAGRKMALQVTQAFQSLLAIVRPAGVNLSL